MRRIFLLSIVALSMGCDDDGSPTEPSGPSVGFFVTSATSATGNLGGLAGADATCQRPPGMARAPGARTSASSATRPTTTSPPMHAIGLAPAPGSTRTSSSSRTTFAELHARAGDAALFVDERAQRINGQWTGSPGPVEHDILTGSNADGTVAAGLTCSDWTSDSPGVVGQVGHSDGMGPNQNTAAPLSSWNAAHANQNCANTAPRGGAGRFYCFAR